MVKIETIEVSVKYKVGLGGFEVPKKVLEQLEKMFDKGDEVDLSDMKYPDATEWLKDNIEESDCLEWSVEINDLTLPD